MPTDSLKQAVEGLEAAWRRLREVLDGPDVSAALVERQAVRPMSTAPRDGTPITLHHVWGDRIQALYNVSHRGWVDRQNNLLREEGEFIGWSPVK